MEQELSLNRFIALLEEKRPFTATDLPIVEDMLSRYPYFTLGAAMMLEADGLDDKIRQRLKAAVALNAPDPESLMKLIDPDGKRFASFYPIEPEPETPSTEKAIDTFLDQYGAMDAKEQSLIERLIFNPTPDYSQVLASQAGDERPEAMDEQDAMLDAFLDKQEKSYSICQEETVVIRPHTPTPSAVMTDAEAPLSESLAKIYIKRGQYDKAYEIIQQLSLNFPKKSIYFADQLRFLRKAMIITDANRRK